MKVQFLGSGGAFAPISVGNSNLMMTSASGKRLLIDFGSTAPYVLRDELGIPLSDIDAVFVSHFHADHAGGLEQLAFSRYFLPEGKGKPILYMIPESYKELWNNTLKGGLDTVQGKMMTLKDYFDCRPMKGGVMEWEEYTFTAVPTVHMVSGYKVKHSYGLYVEREGPKPYIPPNATEEVYGRPSFLFTSDTTFVPSILTPFYTKADRIFHDCETFEGFKSGVHTHYDDLRSLPDEIKAKMYMYHHKDEVADSKKHGFAGFIRKGDSFRL